MTHLEHPVIGLTETEPGVIRLKTAVHVHGRLHLHLSELAALQGLDATDGQQNAAILTPGFILLKRFLGLVIRR